MNYSIGKGGSQKKIENMNAIEQSTTSYSENMEAHKKQKQGFEISISNFDSEKRLQEQHINVREVYLESLYFQSSLLKIFIRLENYQQKWTLYMLAYNVIAFS